MNIVSTLKERGWNVRNYARKGRFLTIAKNAGGSGLYLNIPTDSNPTLIVGAGEQKLAVLRVKEQARVIPNRTRGERWFDPNSIDKIRKELGLDKTEDVPLTRKQFEDFAIRPALKIEVPNSIFVPTFFKSNGNDHCGVVYGHSRARVTDTSFLIGQDESKYFVSILKTHPKTVEEAVEALRPEGLSDAAKRQGEWFFDPVDDSLAEVLDLKFANMIHPKTTPSRLYSSCYPEILESLSSHSAIRIPHEGEAYTFGYVRDSRKGYHKPLYLRGWHRIVRNNERIVSTTTTNYD